MARSAKTAAPAKKKGKSRVTEEEKQEAAATADKRSKMNTAPVVDIFNKDEHSGAAACGILNAILSARKNRPTGFSSLGAIRREFISLPHFYLRWFFGCWGIPQGCLIDVIGAEHIGKTTWGLSFIAWAIDQAKAFGLWIETEEKPLLRTHVWRLMNSTPQKAVIMEQKALILKHAHSLDEMVEVIEEYVGVMRGYKTRGKESVCIPLSQPLVIFIDSLSKLMTPAEAQGFYNYGKNLDAEGMKAKKAILDGSNLVFSKFMHEWLRKLPAFLSENNVLLICAHHQNEKIDMKKGGGGVASFMTEDWGALYNKVKIGGRATNQNAAFQIIMSNMGALKNSSGEAIGKLVRMRMDKNSYAPHGRVIVAEHHTMFPNDVPSQYWEPVLQFDEPFLMWLANENLLDLQQSGKLWACPSLNEYNRTARDIVTTIHARPDIMARLGNDLRVEGYFDPVRLATEGTSVPDDQPTK